MVINECLVSIPWETRNLGVASFEVTQQFIDNPDEENLKYAIKDKIEQHNKIFIQARVAKDSYAATVTLEGNGFYFVEAVIEPYTNLKENFVLQSFISDKTKFTPTHYAKDDWTFAPMNKNDISLCLRVKQIAAESFSDDRFHIDPKCSEEIANARFSFWVDDLLADQNVSFYTMDYLGHPQAFMTRKSDYLVLGGLSKQCAGKGMGKFFWLSVLEDMLNEGLSQVQTLISVNNIPVLNLYVRLGFKFKHPAVTLHYWYAV